MAFGGGLIIGLLIGAVAGFRLAGKVLASARERGKIFLGRIDKWL